MITGRSSTFHPSFLSFLAPSAHSSVSLLIPFFSSASDGVSPLPVKHYFTLLQKRSPSSFCPISALVFELLVERSHNDRGGGVDARANCVAHVLIICAHNGQVDTLSINHTSRRCAAASASANLFPGERRPWLRSAQVEEVSLSPSERVDDILKRGACCHSNHMMRQAELFKGIQLPPVFPSASHRSSKRQRNGY